MGTHHHHDHDHHDCGGHTRGAEPRHLHFALALTLCYMAVEVMGGLLTGSLALLADAGHMASDAGALLVAVVAARVALRPPDARQTMGYQRAEVLGAFVNGLTLLLACHDARPTAPPPPADSSIVAEEELAAGGDGKP